MVGKYLFVISIVAVLFVAVVADVNAQSSDDRWRGLNDLKPGTRIVVDQDGGKPLKAKFASSTDQNLTVMSKGKRVEIDRSTISAVYLGRRSSKLKRGLIGALAGAGAGMLIGAATVAATKAMG